MRFWRRARHDAYNITHNPRSLGKSWAQARRSSTMLWSIAVMLTLVWALGILGSYMLGGFIHVFIAVAVILVLVRAFQRRHPLDDAWRKQPK